MTERRTTPLRGKRTRERRAGDQAIADALARREATERDEIDFDVAEVDREVEDFHRPPPKPAPTPPVQALRGAGRRLPDLSVLPPLLLGTWIGWQLYGKLDERRFRQALALLLIASGATLLF